MVTQEELEKRENILTDLILHLSKVKPEQLQKHTVQEIIEGFWIPLETEEKPFALKGE